MNFLGLVEKIPIEYCGNYVYEFDIFIIFIDRLFFYYYNSLIYILNI